MQQDIYDRFVRCLEQIHGPHGDPVTALLIQDGYEPYRGILGISFSKTSLEAMGDLMDTLYDSYRLSRRMLPRSVRYYGVDIGLLGTAHFAAVEYAKPALRSDRIVIVDGNRLNDIDGEYGKLRIHAARSLWYGFGDLNVTIAESWCSISPVFDVEISGSRLEWKLFKEDIERLTCADVRMVGERENYLEKIAV